MLYLHESRISHRISHFANAECSPGAIIGQCLAKLAELALFLDDSSPHESRCHVLYEAIVGKFFLF